MRVRVIIWREEDMYVAREGLLQVLLARVRLLRRPLRISERH